MADGPTIRRGKSQQVVATPWVFIQAVEARFGSLSCDLAAEAGNAKAPRFITREQNSFTQDWHRIPGLLWLNPEFDPIEPWARKCAQESRLGAKIIMLTPASVGSNWFADYVWPHAHVIALNGRIKFVGQSHGYPKDLLIAVYGGATREFSIWRWNPKDLI